MKAKELIMVDPTIPPFKIFTHVYTHPAPFVLVFVVTVEKRYAIIVRLRVDGEMRYHGFDGQAEVRHGVWRQK